MRCAVLHAPGDIRVEQRPDPVVGAGESLVRVTSVGLCGSDLHWFAAGAIGDAAISRPLVLGHEVAGVVDSGPLAGRSVGIDPALPCGHCRECGSELEHLCTRMHFAGVVVSGPLAGRSVGLDPALPCGRCRECGSGLEHLCTRMHFAGHGETDGGLREFLAWPDRRLHLLPDGYDPASGSLLEPLGVAVHSADLAHLGYGWTVAVIGCGPIGLLLVQLAVLSGCDVVAVEPLPHRRVAALRAGATTALAPDEVVRGSALDGTCDAAFEVSGVDDGLARAADLVRPGARIVLVGIPDEDSTTFTASTMRRKGLTLACARRMTADAYRRAIALAVRGAVDLSWSTSHRFPLDDAPEAFATAARREGLKVVVDLSG